MGTNYYLHVNVCSLCRKPEKSYHIGKSSGGWTFSFRGYRNDCEELKILSYKDWLNFIAGCASCQIVDEYGDYVTLDDFKNLVEKKKDEVYNHTIYCKHSQQEWIREDGERRCWLDDEGNSFSEGEFS